MDQRDAQPGFKMDREIYRRLKVAAAIEGLSVRKYVERILDDYLPQAPEPALPEKDRAEA